MSVRSKSVAADFIDRMKSELTMRKLLISIVMTALICSASTAGATSITVGFSNSTIYAGHLTTDIILSGLPAGGIVSAFDFDVLYNPAALAGLSGVSVSFGSWLGDVGKYEVLQSSVLSSGLIDLASVSLLSDLALQSRQNPAGGSLVLATLNFDGVTSGSTSLEFDWYKGKDVKGLKNEVIAGYVPEPGTFLLVASGFLSVLGYRRRNWLMTKFRR
jgi:hypothetical protein